MSLRPFGGLGFRFRVYINQTKAPFPLGPAAQHYTMSLLWTLQGAWCVRETSFGEPPCSILLAEPQFPERADLSRPEPHWSLTDKGGGTWYPGSLHPKSRHINSHFHLFCGQNPLQPHNAPFKGCLHKNQIKPQPASVEASKSVLRKPCHQLERFLGLQHQSLLGLSRIWWRGMVSFLGRPHPSIPRVLIAYY